MAVKLRLRRMGKKKQPIYKVVAADSRSPRDGKFIESVGLYNPLINPHSLELKEERINYWLDNGAQPSDTVKSLLRQKGITLKRELKRKGLSEDQIQTELDNWAKMKEAQKSTDRKKSKSRKKSEAEAKAAPAAEKSKEKTAESEKKTEPKGKTEDPKENTEEPEVKVAKSEEQTEESKPEEESQNSEKNEEKIKESTEEVKGAAPDENSTEKK